MATEPATRRRSAFFLTFATALGAILLFGFARTFFLQPVFRAKPLNMPLIVHGICGTLWFALFAWQAWLVRRGRLGEHRTNGTLGVALGAAAVASALWIVARTAFDGRNAGSGLADGPAMFIQLGTVGWVVSMIVLGLRTTRRPDHHKRYMTMATIAMLAPAFSRISRLFRSGGAPIADSAFLAVPLIIALAIHDFRSRGSVHPVTLWAGGGYIACVAMRLPLAKSELWNHTVLPALFG